MFAHPATAHLPRTYAGLHPTTGRRKLAVHNENNLGGGGGGGVGGGLPSKTPSRAGPSGTSAGAGGKQLAPATAVRVGLGAKPEGRDRNVLARQNEGGGKEEKGKGKGEEIEPKRLFASTSTLPPSKSLSNLPFITSRPTQPSKTPARPPPTSRKLPPANLRTPAPATFRVAQDTTSTPLPSATRRRRSRSGQGGGTPLKSSSKQAEEFRTPLPSGQRWEEEPSLDSIEEVGPGEGIEMDVLGEVAEEGDLEVEYMPPKAKELPYVPDWDDQLDVEHLMRRMQGVPLILLDSGSPPPEATFTVESLSASLSLPSDEDLEDPIFRHQPPAVSAPSTIIPAKKRVAPISAATSRTGTTISRPAKPPVPSAQARPGILKATASARSGLPVVSARSAPPIARRTAPPGPASTHGRIGVRPVAAMPKAAIEEEDEEMRLAREALCADEAAFDLGL